MNSDTRNQAKAIQQHHEKRPEPRRESARGTHGIHGDKQVLRQLKCDEMDLLAWVISRVAT